MYRIGEIIENNGVKYKVIDFLDKNGQFIYDLKELDGDGELNDVSEATLCKDEIKQLLIMVDNFMDDMYDRGAFDIETSSHRELDKMVEKLKKRYLKN